VPKDEETTDIFNYWQQDTSSPCQLLTPSLITDGQRTANKGVTTQRMTL